LKDQQMAKFFSATTGGFYDDGIHGPRQIQVSDPAWERPTKTVVVPDGEAEPPLVNVGTEDTPEMAPDPAWEQPVRTLVVPDDEASPPIIIIDNPHCSLPTDAVEISDELWQSLLAAQAAGQVIVAGVDGMPEAVSSPPPSMTDAWKQVRMRRDALLVACDWTMLADAPLSATERAAWGEYRQALRDVPQAHVEPAAVVWPFAPDFIADAS